MGTVLLQARNYFGDFGTDSLPPWLVALIVVVVVALVAIGIAAARRSTLSSATPAERRTLTRRSFARTARSLGLTREQAAELERLVTACKVKEPLMVFTNESLLDDVLKRGVYALESSEAKDPNMQAKLRALFVTKQIIENSIRPAEGPKSTVSLQPGLHMQVVPSPGGRFAVRLVANTRSVLAVSTPLDQGGREQRWPKGTKCVVGFTRGGTAGYSFPSRVVGYGRLRGSNCLLLQHAKALTGNQQRRSRRRDLSRPCFIYPVQITEATVGRTTERKAVVLENQKLMGTLSDISAGGCSVRCRETLKKGTLVKVELSLIRRDSVAAFGKVQRIRPEGSGGVMHIMWTRMSAAALNRIYSYVYNYTALG